MRKMTHNLATIAARKFIAAISKPDRQWTISTVECFAPDGWQVLPWASEGDFYPITVANVSRAFRANSVTDADMERLESDIARRNS